MSSKTTKTKSATEKSKGPSLANIIGMAVVAAIIGLSLWGLFGGGGDSESTARPVPATRTPRATAPASSATPAPAVMPTQAPTRRGQPWEYDATTNYHWNPLPGHDHWHQGPPPPEDQRTASGTTITPTITSVTEGAGAPTITPFDSTSAVTPIQVNPFADGRPQRDGQPWEYDAESGFHWDPRPGHQHWHAGEPPPEGQRQ